MNEFVELRNIIAMVLRRWWLVLLLTAAGLAFGYVFSLQQQPVYEATTSVLVGQSIQATQLDSRDIQTSERLALTYADITRRQPVLQAAIESLNLDCSWESLRKRVTVKLVPDTQLLEISVEADTRQEAQMIAAELAQQLILLSPASLQNQRDDGTKTFVNRRLQELQTNIEVGEIRIEELVADLASTETAEGKAVIRAEIDALEEKIFNWESNYARFLAFVGDKESANYITVVDIAHAAPGPVRPAYQLNMIIASAAGFVIAVGLILLLEVLDDTLKTTADISNDLNLPPLGAVGDFSGNGLQNKMIVLEEPFSPAAESYRMIRNNIEFATLGITGKTIMVTSPEPGDGKTVTMLNLGIALANNGNRTILVDSDMRRGVLHELFQVTNHEGLSDQLCRPEPGEYVPVRDLEIERLHLLTSGTPPPNPAELLASHRMEELLTSLKELADVVVLDAPPATLVADPAILSSRVDGVILVVSAEDTRREAARQAIRNLEQAGANILGAVLNRDPSSRGGRYKSYGIYGRNERNPLHDRVLVGLKRLREKFQPAPAETPAKQEVSEETPLALEGIPGVGPKRQQALIEHYHSVEDLRQATTEEIAAETGIPHNVAQAVKTQLG